MKHRSRDGIMGLVVGDALGLPVQFCSREDVLKDPVTTMREYGTFYLPKGSWSDDSSLALCLLESLTTGLNYRDMFDKFLAWKNEGYMTPHDQAFDIGSSTWQAIHAYELGTDPLECGGRTENSNGNGSLMRILPLAYYAFGMEAEERFELVKNISGLTHGHERAIIACGIYVQLVCQLISGDDKNSAMEKTLMITQKYYQHSPEFGCYQRVFDGNLAQLDVSEIRSSGYVVDSLEAALWCFLTTDNFADCLLKAVNLGEDTDTIGAIAGGLAGIYFGYEAIPAEWREVIIRREMIEELCEAFDRSLA